MTTEVPTANRDYVPVRTDPIEGLDARTVKRRLDRQVNDRVPEIHIVGRIASGKDLVNDISEGAFCRWKVAHGKAWQHLGGELIGQTQVGYCSGSVEDKILFEHPIDLHFACAGLQVRAASITAALFSTGVAWLLSLDRAIPTVCRAGEH